MSDDYCQDPAPVRRPDFVPPDGACDSHAHVFGPRDRFPAQPDAAYEGPNAPVETYLAALDQLGMARGVLVQPTIYGFDNSALLDALQSAPERLRGVGLADASVPRRVLKDYAASGMKGLRFAVFPKGADNLGGVSIDEIAAMAPALRDLGMHAQVWAAPPLLVQRLPGLLELGIPVVIDHMARIDTDAGVGSPDMQALLALLRKHEHLWIKLLPNRVTQKPKEFSDVRPYFDAFLDAAPDRAVWGSDWPFVRMGSRTPEAGDLLDLFAEWASDAGRRQALLVDNPARLYGWP